jgi:hypothetical protein
LAGAYSELVVLSEENVPPEAWELIAAARTRLEANGVTVEQNVRRMKNSTAGRLLSGLWKAYEIVLQANGANTSAV